MSIDECIEAFSTLMSKAFKKEHKLAFTFRGKIQHRYDTRELEKAIRSVIVSKGKSPDMLMRFTPNPKCKTFVVAVAKQATTLTHFTNYRKDNEMSDFYNKVKLWEAARATSAATSFFDPIVIDESPYVDGGLGMNNPIDRLWLEARLMFANNGVTLESQIRVVLSVGTGKPALKAFGEFVAQFIDNLSLR